MATIRLTGHVDENGRIEIAERVDLPPGDVIITIEDVNIEDEDDERAFDELLASPKSLAFLDKLAGKALEEFDAGLTDELDPDAL